MANSMYADHCTCRGFELCEFCVLEARRQQRQLNATGSCCAPAAPNRERHLTPERRAELDATWA